jgi:hypothetical protein
MARRSTNFPKFPKSFYIYEKRNAKNVKEDIQF